MPFTGVTQEVNPEPNSIAQKNTSAEAGWSESEIALLRSLWIGSLPPLPPDPSNVFADDPGAAALGKKIFFDPRFSANGKIACATCHQPERYFTDGLARAEGVGKSLRSSPSLLGAAYSPWFFWGGRSDSQWSQALAPLENGLEHGGSRTQYARLLFDDPAYHADYEAVFGAMPDISDRNRFPDKAGPVSDKLADAAWRAMDAEDRQSINRIFVNVGKAIAAYERELQPGPARFDTYVEALLNDDREKRQQALTTDEVGGLRLFLGKARCVTCHLGPLFTNHGFHNVAVPLIPGLAKDWGRYSGVQQVLNAEFNCLSEYSDAGPDGCAELRFVKTARDETIGAFKVPTLRNVAGTAPYMHAGQFASLDEVLDHYNRTGKTKKAPLGHNDLLPIDLSADELKQLKAFLHTLGESPAITPELVATPVQVSRQIPSD